MTDYINSYYPFTFKNNVQISFESLANHSSGLPRLPDNLKPKNPMNPYKDYGKKEIKLYLTNSLKIESKPQTTYAYSNLGAGLLGYTLGLSQEMNFQDLLQKKVFDKYKMKNSFTSSQNLKDNLIKGLNKNGEVVSNWDFDVLFGAGGVLSTTEDLATFAKAQFNAKNSALALTRKPTFTVNDKMKMGLGWHILKSDNDKEIFRHNGGTGGYSSSMAISVDEKTAVIILSNVSGINDKVDALCFELLKQTIKE
nr:serine hydrolase domain-containing protein [Niabella ginsengisoli]